MLRFNAKETLISTGSFKYIKSLDGLRALAILMVLFFHLDEKILRGGFIGVDIFFVISGYIITRNIMSDIGSGNFSLLEFYHKRIARLLPALLVTILLSVFIACFIYPAYKINEFSLVGLLSTLSMSNIYFSMHTGYFDIDTQKNIFLHTWSLGVEEQFYLFWPFLMIFIARFYSFSGTILLSIFILSMIASWFLFYSNTNAAFFLMPSRIFQFLAGALVAIAHIKKITLSTKSEKIGQLAKNTIFIIGLIIIFTAAIFNDGKQYGFLESLLPMVGAVLIIVTIQSQLAKIILATPLLRFIGKRAYSLYLIHWPIIVMTGTVYGNQKSIEILVFLIISSFAVAELLYSLVEQKFRLHKGVQQEKYNMLRSKAVFTGFIVSLMGLLLVWKMPGRAVEVATVMIATVTKDNEGKGDRIKKSQKLYNKELKAYWIERSRLGRVKDGCVLQQNKAVSYFNKDNCIPIKGSSNILILGDSFASEAFIMLSQIFPKDKLLIAGSAGCIPVYPEPVKQIRSIACQKINKLRFDLVTRKDISTIVITTNWQQWSIAQIKSTITQLQKSKKHIVLLGARPTFSESVPSLLDSIVGSMVKNNLNKYITYDIKEIDTVLKSMTKTYKNQVSHVNLYQKLCSSKCRAFLDDGTLIYLDNAHITPNAAIWLGKQMEKKSFQP